MLYLDFILQYVFVSRFLFKTSCFLSFLTYFSCLFLPLVISILFGQFHSSSPTKESFYCLFSNGQFTSSHFHIPITGTEMDVCPTLKFDYPTNFPAICFQFRVWFPSQAEPAVPVSYSSFATSHRCRK